MTSNLARLVAAIAGLGLSLSMASNARALPADQASCNLGANNQQTIHPGEPLKPLSNLVTRVNAASKTLAIVHVAADICVSAGAEARIAYSVDGGKPKVFGPTNLANHQEFCETRATMAIIPLSAGKHKIRPFWVVLGPNNTEADFVQGCMTAEASTD